jgi:hypothetical protein
MKKITLLTGIIASIIILIGVIMKFLHWPGASIALVIGCSLFAILYAPLLFVEKNKVAKNGFQKFVNFIILLAMVTIVIGFLFKAMHWPGAGFGVHIGHVVLLVLIPLLFMKAKKEEEPIKQMNFYNEAIITVILMAFSFFVLHMTKDRESLQLFARMNQNINNTDSLVIKNNNRIYKTIETAGSSSQLEKAKQAKKLSNELSGFIDDIKKLMLMQTEEFNDTAALDTLQLEKLKSKANSDIPFQVLFAGDFENPSKGKARELKMKLNIYKKALSGLLSEKDLEGINLGLNTDSIKTEEGNYLQWEFYTLRTHNLISSLAVLSKLQLDIRVAEAVILDKLANNVIENQLYEIYKLKNPKEKSKTK